MKLSKSWGIIIGALFLLVGLECLARFCLGLGDPPLSIPDKTIDYLFAPNQVCHRFGNLIVYNNVSRLIRSMWRVGIMTTKILPSTIYGS